MTQKGCKQTEKCKKKISETIKRLYKEGKLIAWSTGLTKETDIRIKKKWIALSTRYKNKELTGWNKGSTKETDDRLALGGKRASRTKKRLFAEGKLVNWSKGLKGKEYLKHFKKGHTWNKGLTKETDDRVVLNAKRVSRTRKRLYREGKLHSWNEGLTKETDERLRKQGEKRTLAFNLLGARKLHGERVKEAFKRPEVRKKHLASMRTNETREKFRKNTTKRMKNGFAVYLLSRIKNPSKPQIELFNYVKRFYPTAKLNYSVKLWKDKWYSLDVAVPELKVNFEYDEPFWHSEKNFGNGSETKDFFRDENLIERDWCVVRIKGINELKGIMNE